MVFARCVDRYVNNPDPSRVVDNPKWLMGLYKISLVNEFHYHAAVIRGQREAEGAFAAAAHAGSRDIDHNLGVLGSALADASEELRTVLRIIAGAPAELLDLMLAEADDESWSRRAQRLAGIKEVRSSSVITELRELLTGAR